MNTHAVVVLVTGFVCLFIGLGMYIAISRKKQTSETFYTTNVICWILIALFPALVIFSFFPASDVSGHILGFSMTGAVALFVFIWWFGSRIAWKAIQFDDLYDKIRGLEEDLRKSQELKLEKENPTSPKVLTGTEIFCFALKKSKRKRLGLITGNIQGVKCADIWVNSENTNMQMARFYERSISGTIRYLGAKKDSTGDVIEDVIMGELADLMAGKGSVQPATVLVTDSGELQMTHNVKKIFHVAAARGQVAAGYQPIDNIEFCVKNALDRATRMSLIGEQYKTILFPLLGTGTARGKTEQVAAQLITAALEYLESSDKVPIETVYFLTWTDRELEICKTVLERSGRVLF